MNLEPMIDWTLARIGKLPTTQLIVASGIAAFLGTIALWWLLALLHSVIPSVAAWEPSVSMIGFISAWGVIAAGQFAAKRATDSTYAAAKAGAVVPPAPPTP